MPHATTTFLALAALFLIRGSLAAQPADPEATAAGVAAVSVPFSDAAGLEALIERAAEARLVLLGEASHGTAEFYRIRADISKELIQHHGFDFIAVEGDWASIYELNRYVKDLPGAAGNARDVLLGFERWPVWMWGNTEVLALAEWLRSFNDGRPANRRVGFYGIDVYAPWQSIDAALRITSEAGPEVNRAARRAFRCMEPHRNNPGGFIQAVAGGGGSCEAELDQFLGQVGDASGPVAGLDHRTQFKLEQHALAVRHAKRHYLAMRERGPASWNHRVDHFKLTAARLLDYHGPDARGIVWAHNTHVGDADATSMRGTGQYNIGRLARARFGDDVFIVGFGTHRGRVNAGSAWEAPMERMDIPAAPAGSFEDLLNRTGLSQFYFLMDDPGLPAALGEVWGHRAIGVVYDPARENPGNYVPTIPAERYDAFVFVAETNPLQVVE